jgi:hypothetical protein
MLRHRRIMGSPSQAARVILALAAALGCVGAVAYAAAASGGPARGGEEEASTSARGRSAPGKAVERLPRPRIAAHPEKTDTASSVRFSFSARGEGLRFQCRLDRAAWRACKSPHVVSGLGAAPHKFSVRALRKSRRGPSARFSWIKVDPRPLTVEPQGSGLSALHPGAPAQAIPVRLVNPNAVPVKVTSLTVILSADPPGCPANPNLELAPASLSSNAPIVLPAGGEVMLPSGTVSAPTIALRELPFNQDACQGASLPLSFQAEAHG